MPKLPGMQSYGLAQAPAPNPQLPPSPTPLGQYAQQGARLQLAAASEPNELQQVGQTGTRIAGMLLDAEDEQRKREDAIARSMARTQYYTEADQAFVGAQSGDITSKAGFEALTKQLDEIKQKTIENYEGTDEGRMGLTAQIGDAHADYMRRALVERSQAVENQFKAEAAASSNRLSAQAYDMPSRYQDLIASVDHVVDDMALTPPQQQAMRSAMKSDVAFASIDGLLNKGDFTGADAVRRELGQVLTPEQQASADRRIRGFQAESRKMQDQGWEFGPDGVYRNKFSGEQQIPTGQVRDYYEGMREKGKTSVNIAMQNESEANKAQVNILNDDVKKYRAAASKAMSDASRAEQIDNLLEGIPSGTLAADAAKQLSYLTGINQDQLSDVQAAEKLSVDAVVEDLRKLAPVSDSDRRYLQKAHPGFWQTPEGRKTVVYIFKRSADFAAKMDKAASFAMRQVSEGKLTPGRAAEKLAEYERNMNQTFAATFDPPKKVKRP